MENQEGKMEISDNIQLMHPLDSGSATVAGKYQSQISEITDQINEFTSPVHGLVMLVVYFEAQVLEL